MTNEEHENVAVGVYTNHRDMSAIMGTAHNKAPGRRRPPCLTRHQTLWMPETLENALRDPKSAHSIIPKVLDTLPKSERHRITALSHTEQEHAAWVLNLERFILIVYDKLNLVYATLKYDHPNTSVPEPSLTNYLQKDNKDKTIRELLQNVYTEQQFKGKIDGTMYHNTVCINGIWQSMPVEIIVELRTEYVTITTTIDLGHRKVPGLYDECEQFYYKHLHQALTEFDGIMANRYHQLSTLEPEEIKHLTATYSRLYYTIEEDKKSIWLTCRDDLFGSAIKQVGADNLGRLIGDMRGLVLRYRNDTFKNFITLRHPAEDELEPSTPSLCDVIKGHPFGGPKADDKASRMADIIRIVDTIKPFMLSDPHMAAGATGTTREKQTELSFSTFFDHCGIHASAVSLQNPDPNRNTPLACLSLMTRSEGWEIGRLIDIGNRLNTLRLAALYSYSDMIIANSKLHEVEQGLNEVSRDLLKTLQDTKGNKTVKDKLLRFSRDIAIISYDVPGGLAYRGERSHYYRIQFAAYAKLLRSGEIVGHQPYEEMVERRLGSAYGLINQTSQRLNRITKLMNEIEEDAQTDREVKALEETVKQTKAALDLQRQIGRQTTATTELLGETVKQTKAALDLQKQIGRQTTATTKLLEETVKQTKATTKLLRAAEFGFWAVLFPYYSSTFLLHNVFDEKGIEAVNEWIDGILSYPSDTNIMIIHTFYNYNLVKIAISITLLAYGLRRALRAIEWFKPADKTNNDVNESGAERPLGPTVAR